MFRVPAPQQTKLDELGLTYRIIHQSAGLIRDKFTGQFIPDPDADPRRVKCEICDIATGRNIGIDGIAIDEIGAVIAAVDAIPDEYKATTPAGTLAELAELKARLAKYEAAEAEAEQAAPKTTTKKGK